MSNRYVRKTKPTDGLRRRVATAAGGEYPRHNMRRRQETIVKSLVCLRRWRAIRGALLSAAAVLLLATATSPRANANGPGTSFSVDLDPSSAGIQATRTVPLAQLFSISVVLDITDVSAWIEDDVKVTYDDFRITAPPSGIPPDWSNAPVLDTTGGNLAPFPNVGCGPIPPQNPVPDEDNVGVGTLIAGCYSNTTNTVSYSGPLIQFVLRCDSNGVAAVQLAPQSEYTFILDTNFNNHNDHVHNANVTCGSGTGDADADGMPDSYETVHSCLNPNVADASADQDIDNLQSFDEYTLGTDPCVNDTDTDGCADGEERGPTPSLGGQRNPLLHWDFYDVNASKKVDSVDIGLVRSKFNGTGPTPPEHMIYDRHSGAATWAPAGPDNKINAVDIGLVRAEFSHTCIAAP